MAGLGIKARSSNYKVSAWRHQALFPSHTRPWHPSKEKNAFAKKTPNKSPKNCLFQAITKTTFDRGFFSKLRTPWHSDNTFGREDSTSNPQSKPSQSPLQNSQWGITMLSQSWPRKQVWVRLGGHHTTSSSWTIHMEVHSNTTHLLPFYPLAESCLQPSLASKAISSWLPKPASTLDLVL